MKTVLHRAATPLKDKIDLAINSFSIEQKSNYFLLFCSIVFLLNKLLDKSKKVYYYKYN